MPKTHRQTNTDQSDAYRLVPTDKPPEYTHPGQAPQAKAFPLPHPHVAFSISIADFHFEFKYKFRVNYFQYNRF